MKRSLLICILIAAVSFSAVLAGPAVKYEETKIDLFGAKFMRPVGWEEEVTFTYIQFTSPEDKNLQLVLFEGGYYEGSLDQFMQDYKTHLVDKKKMDILSIKPHEVDGRGAYYVKLYNKADEKDLGHVIFIKDKKPYILALKTRKGQYETYKMILEEAVKTFGFYSPK